MAERREEEEEPGFREMEARYPDALGRDTAQAASRGGVGGTKAEAPAIYLDRARALAAGVPGPPKEPLAEVIHLALGVSCLDPGLFSSGNSVHRRLQTAFKAILVEALLEHCYQSRWGDGSSPEEYAVGVGDISFKGCTATDRASEGLIFCAGVVLDFVIRLPQGQPSRGVTECLERLCSWHGKDGLGGRLRRGLVGTLPSVDHHLQVRLHRQQVQWEARPSPSPGGHSLGGSPSRGRTPSPGTGGFAHLHAAVAAVEMLAAVRRPGPFVFDDSDSQAEEEAPVVEMEPPKPLTVQETKHLGYLDAHPDRDTGEAIQAMRRISEPQPEKKFRTNGMENFKSLATGQVLNIKQGINTTMFVSPRYTHVDDVQGHKVDSLHLTTGLSKAQIRRIYDTFMSDSRNKGTLDHKHFVQCMSGRYALTDLNFIHELFRVYSKRPDPSLDGPTPAEEEEDLTLLSKRPAEEDATEKPVVGFEEFVKCIACFKSGEASLGGRKTQAKALFHLIDRDGDRHAEMMDFFRFITTYMRPAAKEEADAGSTGSRQKSLLDNVEKIYYAFDKSGDGKVDEEEFIAGLCLSDEMWRLFEEVNPFWQHKLNSVFSKDGAEAEPNGKKRKKKAVVNVAPRADSKPGSKHSSRRGSKSNDNFLAHLPAPPPGRRGASPQGLSRAPAIAHD